MSIKTLFFVITLIVFVINTFTIAAVTISGTVHLENKNPLHSYTIKINDIKKEIVKSLLFSASVPSARLYQVKIEADGLSQKNLLETSFKTELPAQGKVKLFKDIDGTRNFIISFAVISISRKFIDLCRNEDLLFLTDKTTGFWIHLLKILGE